MYYSGDINEHIIDMAFEEVIFRTMYNFAIIIVTESISHLVIQENQIAWILNTQLNTIASKILINRKLTSRDAVLNLQILIYQFIINAYISNIHQHNHMSKMIAIAMIDYDEIQFKCHHRRCILSYDLFLLVFCLIWCCGKNAFNAKCWYILQNLS